MNDCTSGQYDASGICCDDPASDPVSCSLGVNYQGATQNTLPSTPDSGTGGLFSGFTSLIGSIGSAVSSTYKSVSGQTPAGVSANMTAATPYPVVVNGQVVGYSAVPSTTLASSGSLGSQSGLLLILAVVVLAFAFFRGRK